MSVLAIKEAIRVACRDAAGVADGCVYWETKARPFADERVILDVITSVQNTYDRVARTPNSSGTLDVEVSVMVELTINVRCESIRGDTFELAERVRSGLALPSVKEALAEAGVCVVGFPMNVQRLDYVIDERDVTAHSFDVEFRAVFHRADSQTAGVIKTVQIAGEVQPEDSFDIEVSAPE